VVFEVINNSIVNNFSLPSETRMVVLVYVYRCILRLSYRDLSLKREILKERDFSFFFFVRLFVFVFPPGRELFFLVLSRYISSESFLAAKVVSC